MEEEKSISTQNQMIISEENEVTVVHEETSLRGEYEKHFLMSDGTYQAVVYSYPVHDPGKGGEVLYYTFNELQFMQAKFDATNRTIEVWYPTVVVKTDYSKQTFLENIIGKDYASN